MKHVASAVFLVVFGLAATAFAGPSNFLSEAELEQLEKALAESQLEHEDLTDDDFDDSDDVVAVNPMKRFWNPLAWFMNRLKNKCSCENNQCDCCFKLKLFQSKACFSAVPLVDEKQVHISLKLDDKTLADKTFNLEREGSVCGGVPVPFLSFLKFCLNHSSTVKENGAFTSCSGVEFKIGSKTGAVLQFECLEFNNGTITMGGHQELEKSAMFELKTKNPFKVAVDLYSKSTAKN